eukprot:5119016-Lingulodinium_polyedra.AAC.1
MPGLRCCCAYRTLVRALIETSGFKRPAAGELGVTRPARNVLEDLGATNAGRSRQCQGSAP